MKKIRPELFFALLILIIGSILVLVIPAGANYDEETYVARIWEMGLGHILPNSYLGEGEKLPETFLSISYRRQVNLPIIDLETFKEQITLPIDWQNLVKHQTRAVYFPTLFIVQAAIMRLFGAHWHLPVLALYFILRFSYLITYCVLVYCAIKIIPFGKWLLGALTVAPMCLIQAASVSSDGVIFGVSFLFIAWVLHLMMNQTEGITTRQLFITCLLIIAIGTLKPNNIFLLFLLLMIPAKKINNKKTKLLLFGTVFLSLILSLGWSFYASTYFTSREGSEVNTLSQFISLFTHPLSFLKNVWVTLSGSSRLFFSQAVGVSGYANWWLPSFIYWVYPIAILLAIWSDSQEKTLTIRQRLMLLTIGLINILAIFAIFFVVETPQGYQGIWGVQGRYFIPFLPLFFLPLLLNIRLKLPKLIPGIILILVALISSAALFLDYHVVCGSSWFSNQPCTLPHYKNWDPNTFWDIPMEKETRIRQNMVIQCEQLSHIQVWVNHKDQNATGKLFFLLETMEFEPLQSQWINAEEIPENGWMTISLEPVVNMKNQEIQFEILPKEEGGIPDLTLAYFPTNEYTRGVIWLNDKGQASDLVFKYGCLDAPTALPNRY